MLIAVNNDGHELNVVAWAMTTNMWEYYITEIDEDNIGMAYVMGFYNEHGSFSLDEIKPHLRLFKRAENLSIDPESGNYIAPPEGYEWKAELLRAS